MRVGDRFTVEGTTWVPDFKLTHTPTRKDVFVELLGFWRKVGVVDREHIRPKPAER